MKIINFADYHLKVYQGEKEDEEKALTIRTLRTLDLFDEMIEYALNNDVKLILCAGDVYDTNQINSTLQREFNKRIYEASKKGLRFIMLAGNHDTHKVKNKSYTIEVFDTLEIPNIDVTKDYKEFIYNEDDQNIRIITLPVVHDTQDIEHILNNQIDYESSNDPIIILGHLTISGAFFNHNMTAENEESIDREWFKKPNVKAVVLGHLHKYQLLMNEPLMFYCGSLQRKDFNEEKDKKGFVLLEIKNDKIRHEFIEFKSAQKFVTLDYNLIGIDNTTEYILDDIEKKKEEIKNAIVRIRIVQESNTIYDKTAIYNKLEEFNAYKVYRIVPTIVDNKRKQLETISESIDPKNATRIYFKDKQNSEEIINFASKFIDNLIYQGKV